MGISNKNSSKTNESSSQPSSRRQSGSYVPDVSEKPHEKVIETESGFRSESDQSMGGTKQKGHRINQDVRRNKSVDRHFVPPVPKDFVEPPPRLPMFSGALPDIQHRHPQNFRANNFNNFSGQLNRNQGQFGQQRNYRNKQKINLSKVPFRHEFFNGFQGHNPHFARRNYTTSGEESSGEPLFVPRRHSTDQILYSTQPQCESPERFRPRRRFSDINGHCRYDENFRQFPFDLTSESRSLERRLKSMNLSNRRSSLDIDEVNHLFRQNNPIQPKDYSIEHNEKSGRYSPLHDIHWHKDVKTHERSKVKHRPNLHQIRLMPEVTFKEESVQQFDNSLPETSRKTNSEEASEEMKRAKEIGLPVNMSKLESDDKLNPKATEFSPLCTDAYGNCFEITNEKGVCYFNRSGNDLIFARKTDFSNAEIQNISNLEISPLQNEQIKTSIPDLNIQHAYPTVQTPNPEPIFYVPTERGLQQTDQEIFHTLVNYPIKTPMPVSNVKNPQTPVASQSAQFTFNPVEIEQDQNYPQLILAPPVAPHFVGFSPVSPYLAQPSTDHVLSPFSVMPPPIVSQTLSSNVQSHPVIQHITAQNLESNIAHHPAAPVVQPINPIMPVHAVPHSSKNFQSHAPVLNLKTYYLNNVTDTQEPSGISQNMHDTISVPETQKNESNSKQNLKERLIEVEKLVKNSLREKYPVTEASNDDLAEMKKTIRSLIQAIKCTETEGLSVDQLTDRVCMKMSYKSRSSSSTSADSGVIPLDLAQTEVDNIHGTFQPETHPEVFVNHTMCN